MLKFLMLFMIVAIPLLAENADLVLINGKIWTGNTAKPWADAIATKGERILLVGSNDEAKKLTSPQTKVLDLQGKLVLPGFIDDHTHFVSGGFQLLSVNLRDAATPQEFARRI